MAFPSDWLSKKQLESKTALSSFVGNTLKRDELKEKTIRYGIMEGEFFAIVDDHEEEED